MPSTTARAISTKWPISRGEASTACWCQMGELHPIPKGEAQYGTCSAAKINSLCDFIWSLIKVKTFFGNVSASSKPVIGSLDCKLLWGRE
ncbi:hypothetical protein XELAEV_18003129mg [Xenopus laevis]|nr:hypothetical protein XELAEV_18003129mg [Xenopus laevis]